MSPLRKGFAIAMLAHAAALISPLPPRPVPTAAAQRESMHAALRLMPADSHPSHLLQAPTQESRATPNETSPRIRRRPTPVAPLPENLPTAQVSPSPSTSPPTASTMKHQPVPAAQGDSLAEPAASAQAPTQRAEISDGLPSLLLPEHTTASGVEYLRSPQPRYPSLARRLGETGKVVVRVLVGIDGLPQRAEIHASSGSASLDDAALEATLRALFKPYLEGGRPAMVWALVPIRFSLDG